MLKWVMAVLLAAPVAFAQQEEKKTGSGQEKTAFEKHSYPFEGEVTVECLNVRMLPKSDNTSPVVSSLGLGEKVTVVGESGDFFQILAVKGCIAWIFAKYIKRDGTEGVVTANDTPVRTDSRSNADKLCGLNEGDKVKIIAEHLGWFKIESPAAVKYFVAKKYVKFVKETDAKALGTNTEKKTPATTAKTTVETDADAIAKIREAHKLIGEMNAKVEARDLDNVDFTGVVQAFEAALTLAKSDAVKKEAESGAKNYREIQSVWSTFKARKMQIEEQIRRLKEEQAKREKPEARVFAFTGYVDTTSFSTPHRPGTHKLVTGTGAGAHIICFLKTKDGDDAMKKLLNDSYKNYVGVNGTIQKDPEGWEGYSVVTVEEIRPVEVKKE